MKRIINREPANPPAGRAGKFAVPFFLICFLLFSSIVWSAELQDIRIDRHKYYDNLIVETSDFVKPKVMLLDNPPRLVIDFKNTKVKAPKTYYKLSSKRIRKVRLGQFEKSTARVVVDLKKLVDYENASIFGKNESVIEIRDKTRPSIYTAAKPPPPSKVTKLKVKKVTPQIVKVEKVIVKKPPEVKIKPEIKKEAEKNITKKKARPSILKGKVIVVDPGHGGRDPGAFGLYGLVERDLTLKTAYKLVRFLKDAGATVYLTRKRNVKVDLKGVAAFTNRIKADAYIGIHYNATRYQKINGTETYYYTRRSRKLAEILHRNIRRKIGRPDRRVRKARLYTVSHVHMPAVIVEPAFLTNPTEARLLQSDKFLKGVAWGITSGLKDYFKWRK